MTTEQAQSGEPVKAKRPRIQPKPSIPAIIDEQEFKKNKSTDNARHVISAIEPITIDLHFDKHYLDRVQHGDDDGTKREGIEPESIQALVLKSIKHLVFYSCHLSSFTFVNMKNSIGTSNNKIRVALRERANGVTLNAIIEAHFIKVNHYEVTVITARCGSKFSVFLGQYVVNIHEGVSTLFRSINNELKKVCEY